MDRTHQPLCPPQVEHGQKQWDLSSGRYATVSRDVPHALFGPQHYEPNYAYPLIVWLHGPQDDERQLLRIMPMVSMRNYVAVAPRGMSGSLPSTTGRKQPAWSPAAEVAQQAEQCVFDSISLAWQKYHISPERIFLAGFDTGGTMAYHLALSYPQHFAGVLSLGGAFPVGHQPFRNLDQARQLAVFVAAGRDSTSYGPEKVCSDLRLMHSAGLSITLRQYPCGQELCPQMLGDMDRWVIEQITSGAE